jgi:hypothetical protein
MPQVDLLERYRLSEANSAMAYAYLTKDAAKALDLATASLRKASEAIQKLGQQAPKTGTAHPQFGGQSPDEPSASAWSADTIQKLWQQAQQAQMTLNQVLGYLAASRR